jgi:hypothetical protein
MNLIMRVNENLAALFYLEYDDFNRKSIKR